MNQSLASTQAALVIVIIVITVMLPVAGQRLVHIVTMYNAKSKYNMTL